MVNNWHQPPRRQWMKQGRMTAGLLVGFLALMLLGSTVAQGGDSQPEVLLRLHGSNTVGAKLGPALAMALLKEKMDAQDVQIVPARNNEVQVVGRLASRQVAIEIHSHGSSTGFKDLQDERCDIAMASRPIKDQEVRALSFLGNMKSGASEHIVGLDGIAVIVHPDNPLKSISLATLRDIFAGRIKDWSQVTSMSGAIEIHARDDKSGTYDTFKHLVLGSTPLSSKARRHEANRALSDTVAGSRLAIGFTGLPYVLRAKALAVADDQAAAIQPDRNSVLTEDYALSRRLYLYAPQFSRNPYSNFFLAFALSDAGQEIVNRVGFVDQQFTSYRVAYGQDHPYQRQDVFEQLRYVAGAAERLSVNFRFRPQSDELDERGSRDLFRVVSYLKQQNRRYAAMYLIGFADNQGDYDANYALAAKRARTVRHELQKFELGLQIRVMSGGEEVPVASNQTPEGRQRNRRVELWLM